MHIRVLGTHTYTYMQTWQNRNIPIAFTPPEFECLFRPWPSCKGAQTVIDHVFAYTPPLHVFASADVDIVGPRCPHN